ncbi:hypothetical protein GGH12_000129 [Coemansia sp. RSA 1822]|nr:hypothetical protein LPJ76_000129 [Coemansia sp. RSA 638]KAJ2545929.1 hypothetical protein GGF49_000132 [Coemansia sp. RSA 1853]KAJ2567691.1 hypothetical protein GGH12_000129 [Coemansia sp. RSA 1822]
MSANQQPQVTLGYSDGSVEPGCTDAFTSKLGGLPQWLDDTSAIPAAAHCGQCGSAMVQLAQAYAPLDGSPYDRVLYIWACCRRACTGKPGAARAVRAHLLNTEYALKLAKQNKPAVKRKVPSALAGGLFGNTSPTVAAAVDFGSVWRSGSNLTDSTALSDSLFTGPLFGKQAPSNTGDVLSCKHTADAQSESLSEPLFGKPKLPKVRQGLSSSCSGEDSLAVEDLSARLCQIAISPEKPQSEWPTDMESVAAQYLAFETETLADDEQIHQQYRTEIDQALDLAAEASCHKGKGSQAAGSGEPNWSEERYERAVLPKGTDAAFSRFTYIVEKNPEQVMRYQFGGRPLLYTTQDDTARVLGAGTDTANDDDDDDDDAMCADEYLTSKLSPCPHCGGQRVFECQLMPALLTVLELPVHTAAATVSTKERLAGSELMRAFDMGLEFGTMLVYVCAADCHGGQIGVEYLGNNATSMSKYTGATYYEELVLVQLEAHMD